MQARTVTLKVKSQDFDVTTRAHTFGGPVRTRDEFMPIVLQLFKEHRGRHVRLLGIRFTGLSRVGDDPERVL